MRAATAACVYPALLRSSDTPALSLTAQGTASAPSALASGLAWWPLGLVLAVFYLALLFRIHRGKVQAPSGSGY